jgi:hypothetical protein
MGTGENLAFLSDSFCLLHIAPNNGLVFFSEMLVHLFSQRNTHLLKGSRVMPFLKNSFYSYVHTMFASFLPQGNASMRQNIYCSF